MKEEKEDNFIYYAGIDPYQPKLKWYQRVLKFLRIRKYEPKSGIFKLHEDGTSEYIGKGGG